MMQFAVKAKRFGNDSTISPGPATYKLPDSCEIRNPKLKMASYQSMTRRELQEFIKPAHPGVGEYNTGDHKAIGSSTMKGGGAPANFTIGYHHLNPTIRRVETVIQPRLPNSHNQSKCVLVLNRIIHLIFPFSSSRRRPWLLPPRQGRVEGYWTL